MVEWPQKARTRFLMSHTSPLSIAAAIVCALLFVAGLGTAGYGCLAYAHRDDPIAAERSDLNDRNTRGEFVSSLDYAGDMKIAATEAVYVRTGAIQCLVVGGVLMLPLFGLGVLRISRGKSM